MSRTETSATARRWQLEGKVETGLICGVASALPTAGMLALGGVLAGVGPAVPFYAIMSILAPDPLTLSLAATVEGATPDFFQQAFSAGLGICLVLGALSGVVFILGMSRRPVQGVARYVVGAFHGVAMMCFFYLGGMRLVGMALGLEVDAMSLSTVIGWPALVAAHAVHGVVLAWLSTTRLAARREVFAQPAE